MAHREQSFSWGDEGEGCGRSYACPGLCRPGACVGLDMEFGVGKLEVMAYRDRSFSWREGG